jgi:hypothetical protein
MDVSLSFGEHENHTVTISNSIDSTSPVPCYLLKLPWEVRNRILRHLLYSDEPLRLLERDVDDDDEKKRGSQTVENEDDEDESDESEDCEDDPGEDCEDDEDDKSDEETDDLNPQEGYCKNYSFSPQVMRTCRQLCDEGKLVLDSNTIGIDLCTHFGGDDWQWAVAGYCQEACIFTGMWLSRRVERMFQQAKRFHIFMDLRELKQSPGYDYSTYLYLPAPQLCKRLVEKQNLKQCRINVTIKGFANEEVCGYQGKGCSFLASFHMLRCNEFSIVGCHRDTAYGLNRSILADEPARNLWAMYKALERFVMGNSYLKDYKNHAYCRLRCKHSDDQGPLRPWLMELFGDSPDVIDEFGREYFWDDLQEAVMWGEVDDFLSLRSSLFGAIDKALAKKKRELLELDFACKGLVEEK